MQRKNFIQQSLLASAGIFTAASAKAEENIKNGTQPFHLNYAIHDGIFINNGIK